ncbi:phosphatidylserine decarboxylase 1 [Blastocladiella emersonii ATCC 22665]|nr:phosphatidylserine decarboxylase 1 [Blastocladiella emersonii ATCC 22665]
MYLRYLAQSALRSSRYAATASSPVFAATRSMRVARPAAAVPLLKRACYSTQPQPQQQQKRQEEEQQSGWSLPRIPIGVGLAVIAAVQIKHVVRDQHEQAKREKEIPQGTPGVEVDGSWLAHVLRKLPLRTLSRAWGVANNELEVPEWLRSPFYSAYSWVFDCQLHEMVNPDLTSYRNLGAFFYRAIDLAAHRPVDPAAPLIMPADGTLLHWGKVDLTHADADCQFAKHSIVHGIKGVGYNLHTFLGGRAPSERDATVDPMLASADAHPATDLYYAVIYLAPGDYHRFHSPAQWTVRERRHIHGELLSVSPRLLAQLPTLFALNERVALLGEWTHGMFAMVPVGATNVGSVRINFDPELATNHPAWAVDNGYGVERIEYNAGKGVHLGKMDEIGGFMLGSTVVLVFEAPRNGFKWAIDAPQGPVKVRVGQTLATIEQ